LEDTGSVLGWGAFTLNSSARATYRRDLEDEARTRRNVENNPTKVRLVGLPKEWPWASAWIRDA